MRSPIHQSRFGTCLVTLCLTMAMPLMTHAATEPPAPPSKIVYLVSSLDFAFWKSMGKGICAAVKRNGYTFKALSSNNSAETQLDNAKAAIASGVAGIVISPTDSATAPAVLALAQAAHIPVVIADIGTNSGDYVSLVTSDNQEGAYQTGKALLEAMKAKGWGGGSVSQVTLSLARQNGQLRTAGFRQALAEGSVPEGSSRQMQTYTVEETLAFTQELLVATPGIRGLFIQTDTPTLGAVQAIRAAKRSGDIAVAAFDGTPEFIELFKNGDLVVSGMQQPYLMGQQAGEALAQHLKGNSVAKQIVVPILVVTRENLEQLLPTIQVTVFANVAD
jgi:hypothetical protein